MSPASNLQVMPAQEAGRPQPQTTIEPPGGPFIRHSQPGRRSQYQQSSVAFSGMVTQPLVAVPGYIKGYRLRIQAASGASTTGSVTSQADAPFSAVSLVTLKDAFGTPVLVGPGYEILYLVPKYSGQYGLLSAADIKNMPSYSAPATGNCATGNYTFATMLPLEFAKAYGVVSGANASLLPTLQLNFAASSSVFATAPTTAPVHQVNVDADFYWLPDGNQIEPPAPGTTCQWVLANANPTIGNAGTVSVQLPRLGGYLTAIILIMRDSTGARIDGWPSQLRLTVDGVPLIDSRLDEIYDDIYNQFGGITRDTGVIAFTRKTSLAQISLGLFDTGETFLSTNPGTLIQIEGAPWGTVSNAPATLSCIVGQVVPSGALIQGLPEL